MMVTIWEYFKEQGGNIEEFKKQNKKQTKKINKQDNRTEKQKYQDRVKNMSSSWKSFIFFNEIVVPKLEEALYDINKKALKDFAKYNMKNGLYKVIVKERKPNWVVISVGVFQMDNWEKKTLDYFVWNKKIAKHHRKWDILCVDLNLDKETKNFDVKEFVLKKWDKLQVKPENYNITKDKKIFIDLWYYKSLIPIHYLDWFENWDSLEFKVVSIKDDKRQDEPKYLPGKYLILENTKVIKQSKVSNLKNKQQKAVSESLSLVVWSDVVYENEKWNEVRGKVIEKSSKWEEPEKWYVMMKMDNNTIFSIKKENLEKLIKKYRWKHKATVSKKVVSVNRKPSWKPTINSKNKEQTQKTK